MLTADRQQPMRQVTPPVQYVQNLERSLAGDLGISVEGTNASVPGDDPFHSLSSNQLTLLPVDRYGSDRYIELFHTGINDLTWKIAADKPYVTFSKSTGNLAPDDEDIRVTIKIDWTKAPVGSSTALINITSSTGYGAQFSMPTLSLPINNTAVPSTFKSGFVESDLTISIEAEHYSRVASNSSSASYVVIPDFGKTLSAVTLFPATAPSQSTTSGPALEYDFYTFTSAAASRPANITLILGTGLNANPTRPLQYAIAIDDQAPKTVKYIIDQTGGNLPIGWGTAVADAAWKSTTSATFGAGAHKLKIWALEPGVVIQKIVIDLGGVRASYLGPSESKKL